jgi:hypothetical protein
MAQAAAQIAAKVAETVMDKDDKNDDKGVTSTKIETFGKYPDAKVQETIQLYLKLSFRQRLVICIKNGIISAIGIIATTILAWLLI